MNCMRRFTVMVVVVLLGVTSMGEALAERFNEKTIKGTWTLFVQGFVAPEGDLADKGIPPGTPLVAIATVTFDGLGNCESIDQLVAGGTPIPEDSEDFRMADACNYVVNSDGTGYFKVTFPGFNISDIEIDQPTTTTARFVIRDNQKMHFIAHNTQIGIYGGGEMERQKGGRPNDLDQDD